MVLGGRDRLAGRGDGEWVRVVPRRDPALTRVRVVTPLCYPDNAYNAYHAPDSPDPSRPNPARSRVRRDGTLSV
jgi:hypothetical protein